MANYPRLLGYVLLTCLLLLRPEPLRAQLLDLPPEPKLSNAGLSLIYEFEVGGGEKYYNRYLIHPEWPGAASGVTIGVGYDLGYNSATVITKDWYSLGTPTTGRLATASGVTGQSARAILPRYRDISIQWDISDDVFKRTTLSRFWALAQRTLPGFNELRPNAQAALVSLVFNRGSSMAGESRREMRKIRDLVPHKDYTGIAAQIRSMERLWRGTDVGDGLIRRREAEAKLVLTP